MKKNSMNSYANKRSKQTKTSYDSPMASPSKASRKSVDIQRAENGFIVSQWVPGTESKPGYDRKIICSTMEEAQRKAASLLKM